MKAGQFTLPGKSARSHPHGPSTVQTLAPLAPTPPELRMGQGVLRTDIWGHLLLPSKGSQLREEASTL